MVEDKVEKNRWMDGWSPEHSSQIEWSWRAIVPC